MGPLKSALCKKCGKEKEFSYHTLFQSPPLVGHRLEINQDGVDSGIMVWAIHRMIPTGSGNSTMHPAVV
jgi:hypothetical protein